MVNVNVLKPPLSSYDQAGLHGQTILIPGHLLAQICGHESVVLPNAYRMVVSVNLQSLR